MQGQHSNQSSFFGMIHDELIPADHLLRKAAAYAFVPQPANIVVRVAV